MIPKVFELLKFDCTIEVRLYHWSSTVAKSDITKTRLFKYIENFTTKHWEILDKKYNIFHISAQNIDCEYSLEPPRRGGSGSNEYPQSMFLSRNKKHTVYSCKPHFYYLQVGFKGTNIIEICFRDGKLWSRYLLSFCHDL